VKCKKNTETSSHLSVCVSTSGTYTSVCGSWCGPQSTIKPLLSGGTLGIVSSLWILLVGCGLLLKTGVCGLFSLADLWSCSSLWQRARPSTTTVRICMHLAESECERQKLAFSFCIDVYVYSWGTEDSTLALITWRTNGETKGGAHSVIAIWLNLKNCVGIVKTFSNQKGKWAPSCLGFDANRNPSKHRKGKIAQRASEQCGKSRVKGFH